MIDLSVWEDTDGIIIFFFSVLHIRATFHFPETIECQGRRSPCTDSTDTNSTLVSMMFHNTLDFPFSLELQALFLRTSFFAVGIQILEHNHIHIVQNGKIHDTFGCFPADVLVNVIDTFP